MSRKVIFLLLVILIIAVFFRFWKINQIPPGLYPDEAMNGNNALEAIKTGDFKLFYPENNGREGLFINLEAVSLMIFGNQPWALRIVSALFGFLTVLGLFFLAKEVFPQKPSVPYFSAFLLAVSFWHVNFSRIGFRAIMTPLCLVWFFVLLLIAFRQKKIFSALLSGIFFGLGFHTYIVFRIAPLLAFVPVVYYFLVFKHEKNLKKYFSILAVWLITAFIIAAPLAFYFLKHPDDFLSRSAPISILYDSKPLLAFFQNIGRSLLMFNFSGDCNWRHNLSCWPELEFLSGIFFIIGIYLIIKNFRKKQAGLTEWTMIIWFIALGLPALLTKEGMPHALRSIGLIPAVFLAAGSGMAEFFHWLKQKIKNKRVFINVFALIILFISGFEGCRYFVFWANNSHVKDAFSQPYWEIGQYLNNLPASTNKYIIVNTGGVLVKDIPMPSQSVMFLTNTYLSSEQKKKNFYYFLPENLDKMEIKKPVYLIPLAKNEETKNLIIQKCPDCQFKDYSSFWVFENK